LSRLHAALERIESGEIDDEYWEYYVESQLLSKI